MKYDIKKASRRPITSDIRARSTAHPRYDSVYANATQFTFSMSSNSVPIVKRLVATIELSKKLRKRPVDKLLTHQYKSTQVE
jgi:hypothetical protein